MSTIKGQGPVDPGVEGSGGVFTAAHIGPLFANAGYCGHSFDEGLLRFHDSASAPVFREHVLTAFPDLKKLQADVVAFDWQGRQIVSTNAGTADDPELLVADIGRGEVGEFCSLSQFTDILRDDVLVAQVFDEPLYLAWKTNVGGRDLALPFSDCAAFSLPLYVGGEAKPENIEQTDMDMSWSIGSQIWAQVRNLPPGTPVRLSL